MPAHQERLFEVRPVGIEEALSLRTVAAVDRDLEATHTVPVALQVKSFPGPYLHRIAQRLPCLVRVVGREMAEGRMGEQQVAAVAVVTLPRLTEQGGQAAYHVPPLPEARLNQQRQVAGRADL